MTWSGTPATACASRAFGSTAWRISMYRRQVVESANGALKGAFAVLSRGFVRVFGRTKISVLLGFTIAAHNVDRVRSFRAKQADDEAQPRRRAKRRLGTWSSCLDEPAEVVPDGDTGPPGWLFVSNAPIPSGALLRRVRTSGNRCDKCEPPARKAGGSSSRGGRRACQPRRHLQRRVSWTRSLSFHEHPSLEVAGIEPASFSFSSGILRAQPAAGSRGPHRRRRIRRPPTDLWCPRWPVDGTTRVSPAR